MEAKEYRFRGRQVLNGCWPLAIAVTFVASVLGASLVGSNFNLNIELDEIFGENFIETFRFLSLIPFSSIVTSAAFLSIAQFIVGGPTKLGLCRFYLGLHDRKNTGIEDLFSQYSRFGVGFALQFLTSLYIFLWSLLLVIPGIVASYRYAMAPYILEENPDMTASEAIAASKEMMEGHKGELFWLDLTFIGWDLLAALTLGIGNLVLNPYKTAARTVFYRNLTRTF